MKPLVHGDDFVPSGDRSELEWLCRSLQKKFGTTDDHGGGGRGLAQGGDSAEPHPEVATPTSGIIYEAQSMARGSDQSRKRIRRGNHWPHLKETERDTEEEKEPSFGRVQTEWQIGMQAE